MVSRQGRSLSLPFPELTDELHELPDGIVMDAELVALDDRGHPQFDQLCARAFKTRPRDAQRAAVETPAAIFAFDLLRFDGRDLRHLPLLKRKATLKHLLSRSTRIRYVHHIGENGERLFSEIERLELEGVVAKRADSPYRAGRSGTWVKVKTAVGKAREALRRETER